MYKYRTAKCFPMRNPKTLGQSAGSAKIQWPLEQRAKENLAQKLYSGPFAVPRLELTGNNGVTSGVTFTSNG